MQHAERLTDVKTKIIATVGPACESVDRLRALAVAGADLFRLNLAHGTRETHDRAIDRIGQIAAELGRPLAILADLPGPKIRLGRLAHEPLECREDSHLELVAAEAADRPDQLPVDSPPLFAAIEADARVLLADGAVGLRVVEVQPGLAVCRVEHAGLVRSNQGVALPGLRLSLPALTEADRQEVAWAATRQIDFLGLSFASGPEDVADLRRELAAHHCDAQVVAKIERAQALGQLEAIVDAADAVMVARGDLGLEIDVARVPIVQKQIIDMCNRRRVPVITATQMLDSMRNNSRPTRAEASDVANAILDGSDALMLSGETAVGQYPVESAVTMSRIARETEQLVQRSAAGGPASPTRSVGVTDITDAVVHGASRVAEFLGASLVIVATHSGRTALALSKQRNFVPTVATSDVEATLRRLCLYWGVTPLQAPQIRDGERLLRHVLDWGFREHILERGDRVVLVVSTHWAPTGHDMILVHEVE